MRRGNLWPVEDRRPQSHQRDHARGIRRTPGSAGLVFSIMALSMQGLNVTHRLIKRNEATEA
jgi:hypothetical protein